MIHLGKLPTPETPNTGVAGVWLFFRAGFSSSSYITIETDAPTSTTGCILKEFKVMDKGSIYEWENEAADRPTKGRMEVKVRKLPTQVQIILPSLPSHFRLQADSEDPENLASHWTGTVERVLKSNASTGSPGQTTRQCLCRQGPPPPPRRGAAGCREPAGSRRGLCQCPDSTRAPGAWCVLPSPPSSTHLPSGRSPTSVLDVFPHR